MASRGQTTSIPTLPVRHPVTDDQGNISRPWLVALQNLNTQGTAAPSTMSSGTIAYAW
jgi:hypothetical protein